MGCSNTEEKEPKKYTNIIDCLKSHRIGHKNKKTEHQDQETGFQFGAPTDLKTNELLEEIDKKLYEEELNEGECSDCTIIQKIELTNARDFQGPTKIDS